MNSFSLYSTNHAYTSQMIFNSIPYRTRTLFESKYSKNSVRNVGCFCYTLQEYSIKCEGNVKTSLSEEIENQQVEVLTLGNLCVDVIVNVENLPPEDKLSKQKFMKNLIKSPPDESCWEGGGNSNFLFAASRIGLNAFAYGHIGQDIFGNFLKNILESENISIISVMNELSAGLQLVNDSLEDLETRSRSNDGDHDVKNFKFSDTNDEDFDKSTLVCWVLIDRLKQHSFFSRFDVTTRPAFEKMDFLWSQMETHLQTTRSLFCNGFLFDEFPSHLAVRIFKATKSFGTKIFFDPGPRIESLVRNKEKKAIFEKILNLSDVLLLTHEEAQLLSEEEDPVLSLKTIHQSFPEIEWVVIKLGKEGCLLSTAADGMFSFPGFQVPVRDTVGCGDSFAAAIVLGYIRGLSKGATLALANAVGAATAMGTGAGRNVATAAQTAQILASSRRFEFPASNSTVPNFFCFENSNGSSVNGVNGHSEIQTFDMQVSMQEALQALSLMHDPLESVRTD